MTAATLHALRRGATGVPQGQPIVIEVASDLAPLVDQYLANRRAEAPALLAALAIGDYDSIWERAHNMKGVGASYGFDFLSDVGAMLEVAARHQAADAVEHNVAALIDYLARLEVQIQGAEVAV
jgi:HPt (histidine-containing phosphotransfer) domain-containing protein